jgi:hypothetical protein
LVVGVGISGVTVGSCLVVWLFGVVADKTVLGRVYCVSVIVAYFNFFSKKM